MRCWLVVLAGCGRLGFDAAATPPGDGTPGDSGTDDGATNLLVIEDPVDGAVVGGSVLMFGACPGSEPVEAHGPGVRDATSSACTAGKFRLEVLFTDGLGSKLVTVAQGTRTASRTYQRVAAPIVPRATGNGSTVSAGLGVTCDLAIPNPAAFEGDLLIGMIYTDGGGTGGITVAPAAGFTQLFGDATHLAFFKIATGEEPAKFEFGIIAGTGADDTCGSAGAILAFRNVVPESAISGSSSQTAQGVNLIAPSIGGTADHLIVGLFGSNGPGTGIDTPVLMTVESGASAISSDGFANALIAWETLVDGGTTGSRNATIANSAANAAGLVGLVPR